MLLCGDRRYNLVSSVLLFYAVTADMQRVFVSFSADSIETMLGILALSELNAIHWEEDEAIN